MDTQNNKELYNIIDVVRIKPTIKDLLIIRSLCFNSINDYTTLQKLKVRLGFSPYSLLFTKYLFNNFYLLMFKGDPIGFGITRKNKLRALFCIDSMKNKGYGSFLLNEIELDLKCLGYDYIFLKPSKQAIKFYQKKGYIKKKFYWYKDLV